MPKVPAKGRKKTSRNGPTKAAKPRDAKASHLYTDNNPATTVYGTGFKDKATAVRTLELVKNRSLIYQFQTINTMYNRAKHHPAMEKAVEGSAGTADMSAAMDIFRTWLDETYPAERNALRAGGFKPLLSKKCVKSYLPRIEASKTVEEDAKKFARVYSALPRGKKLGNVLVDDSKPADPDWERKRYDELNQLVPTGREDGADSWKLSELWIDERDVSEQHLRMIAWAWSPVLELKLT